MRPGTPNPSMPGEAFMDTPIVNGTAYPYLEVEPKAYRFRILNAANDRIFNLQLYVAADKTIADDSRAPLAPCCAPAGSTLLAAANCTEVKMVPAAGLPNQLADTPSGVPDPATEGPDWIQIGTEGGFLPKPAVVPSQPIGWNLNPTTFNFGNVNQHSLLLGSAERADVVVDFSAYAGKTLILYNDAPAAFPAGVPSYDYFTGNPDQMDTGGAPTTQPGYGPNTRTIMQIRVGTAVTTAHAAGHAGEPQRGVRQDGHARGACSRHRRSRSSSRRRRTTRPTTTPSRPRPPASTSTTSRPRRPFCRSTRTASSKRPRSRSRSSRRRCTTRWAACTTRSSAA